jgi:hypothetical protein
MTVIPVRALQLWPGLPGLWMHGRWSSLVLAAGFALLLNLALAGTFLWPDLWEWQINAAAWPILAIVWAVSFWHSRRASFEPDFSAPAASPDADLFIQAQTEYLKGNWDTTRRLLTQRLTAAPRDLESRLLLATMLRRTGSSEPARHQLQSLQRLDGSAFWQREIDHELALLTACEVGDNTAEPGGAPADDLVDGDPTSADLDEVPTPETGLDQAASDEAAAA